MTEKQIAEIMERPFEELWSLSRDRQIFRAIVSLAITKGKHQATQETHLLMNQAFQGYNEVTLAN